MVGGRRRFGWGLEGLVLASYDFGGTEVHVLYYAIVIEEDVWRAARSELDSTGVTWGDKLTLGLDISMGDTTLVQIC